ncbi:hypothetical protein [Neptunicoccus sediminis]|uniref:hypothetical protein n=1 Tax=Neptunicoccus sediminis TaxID=1892596 RepID=UPI000845D42F|nr:hypothetical protein [Neptunicoccus sediminis]
MKLALHIGTTKTGTTSCQHWFAGNREALAQQGVIYPESLGEVNHRKLMVYGRDSDKPDEAFRRNGVHTKDDHAAFRKTLEAEFAAEVAAHPQARHWVISNEHLHSKITTVRMIRRVRDFLAPHFTEITVYLHLRPQVDLLVSGASQRARLGKPVTPAALTRKSVSENSAYFNYDQIVSRWEEVFGAEHLRIVPFLRQSSITAHLAEEIGIDRSGLNAVPHHNEAIDWRTMGLVNALGEHRTELGNLTAALDLRNIPVEESLQIGLTMAQEVQERFNRSNARLVKRRDDLEAGDLIPDWSRYDEVPNIYRLDDSALFGAQLAHVLTHYRQGLALERARALLAEAALDFAEKRKNIAREKLEQARATLELKAPQDKYTPELATLQARADELAEQFGKGPQG